MHKYIRDFITHVSALYPPSFTGKKVLDVGSLDVNGTNREHFRDCVYFGLDLAPGKNVDYVSPCHEFRVFPDNYFDVIISTDMLEHDQHWHKSMCHMVDLLHPGGLWVWTAAGPYRATHGVIGADPSASPLTNDYYRNIETGMVRNTINLDSVFREYCIQERHFHGWGTDIQFWGIKNE